MIGSVNESQGVEVLQGHLNLVRSNSVVVLKSGLWNQAHWSYPSCSWVYCTVGIEHSMGWEKENKTGIRKPVLKQNKWIFFYSCIDGFSLKKSSVIMILFWCDCLKLGGRSQNVLKVFYASSRNNEVYFSCGEVGPDSQWALLFAALQRDFEVKHVEKTPYNWFLIFGNAKNL